MEKMESSFSWLLRIAGAAGLAIYAIIMILWFLLVTGVDDKGTSEPHLQGWDEFALMGYGVLIAIALIYVACRAAFSEKRFGVKIVILPIIVLTFHGWFVFSQVVAGMQLYLLMSHAPLLAGIVFLGFYVWRNREPAPNQAPKPTQ